MHQSLSGHTLPVYLADYINLVSDSGRRLHRSASNRTCLVPRIHSDRSFADAGPRVWNGLVLPLSLRQDISYEQFKGLLKTFLFGS